MSRVVKFRAYDGAKIRYDVTGFEHGRENEMAGVFLDGTYYAMSENNVCQPVAIVMQFTGLADKNGVEIYESDIVLDHVGTGQVKYSSGNAAFRVVYGNGRAKWFYDYFLRGERESMEVVGNIYQDSHLLNDKPQA